MTFLHNVQDQQEKHCKKSEMTLFWECSRGTATAFPVKFIRHLFQTFDDFFGRRKNIFVMACVTGGRIFQHSIRIRYHEPTGFHEEALKIAYAIVSVVTSAHGDRRHEFSNGFKIAACFPTRRFVSLVLDHPVCQNFDAFISGENTTPKRFNLSIFVLNPFF